MTTMTTTTTTTTRPEEAHRPVLLRGLQEEDFKKNTTNGHYERNCDTDDDCPWQFVSDAPEVVNDDKGLPLASQIVVPSVVVLALVVYAVLFRWYGQRRRDKVTQNLQRLQERHQQEAQERNMTLRMLAHRLSKAQQQTYHKHIQSVLQNSSMRVRPQDLGQYPQESVKQAPPPEQAPPEQAPKEQAPEGFQNEAKNAEDEAWHEQVWSTMVYHVTCWWHPDHKDSLTWLRLPVDTSRSQKGSGSCAVPNECSICLEQYEPGQSVTWATHHHHHHNSSSDDNDDDNNNNNNSSGYKCPHAFHTSCLLRYAETVVADDRQCKADGILCPLCRAPFIPPPPAVDMGWGALLEEHNNHNDEVGGTPLFAV